MQVQQCHKFSTCKLYGSGPDGVGNYKVSVNKQHYIGNGFTSPEASSDTNYLWRASKVLNIFTYM